MAKGSGKKARPGARKVEVQSREKSPTTPGAGLLEKRPWIRDLLAILAMYIVTFALFFPFIVEDTRFSTGGDAVAARAWNSVGDELAETEEGLPLWNPYVFLGIPSYGSLSYHPDLAFNPMSFIERVGSSLFGPHPLNKQIFYYFLSGVLMYLFARGVGLSVLPALLAGLIFLLNPYNISLADAGHGSKHWTIALMPLVMLLTHKAVTRRSLLWAGLLALGLAMQLLALHVQIVYYTLLACGGYVLVWFIGRALKELKTALNGLGTFALGSGLGFALSAYIYLPVYVYQQFSIRGAPPLKDAGGGGLTWEYATGWSLHPLESLQFLVPGLFGLGGNQMPDNRLGAESVLDYNLYWGWMPFTQSSLYMGILALLLAVLAVVLLWKKDGVVRWLALSGLLAWVLAFGKYLPVLYWPMFKFMPFFDKFRVPSMSLVLTALAVSLLAGYGVMEMGRRLARAREESTLKKRWQVALYVVGGLALLGVLVGIAGGSGPDAGSGLFLKAGELRAYGQQTASALVQLRYLIFTKTLLSTSLILLLFAAVSTLVLQLRKGGGRMAGLLGLAAVLLTVWDLGVLDARFLDAHPARNLDRTLAATPAVNFLKRAQDQSEEPFRIFPFDSFQSNYWMYHRIGSIGGYAAVKMRIYQDMLDYGLGLEGRGLPNLKLAGMMNARYLVTSADLPGGFERVFEDPSGRQHVYRNPLAMPRAWFVDVVRVVDSPEAMMASLNDPGFNPRQEAQVLEAPEMGRAPQPDSTRRAVVPRDRYTSKEFELDVQTADWGFLVVSEIFYPQGWKAMIDGEETRIYRTNYGLRGVAVPPGEHTIRMVYDPPEVRAGLTLSMIAFGIVLILILIGGALLRAQGMALRMLGATPSTDAEKSTHPGESER